MILVRWSSPKKAFSSSEARRTQVLEKCFTPDGPGPGALDPPRLGCSSASDGQQGAMTATKPLAFGVAVLFISVVMHGKQVYSLLFLVQIS